MKDVDIKKSELTLTFTWKTVITLIISLASTFVYIACAQHQGHNYTIVAKSISSLMFVVTAFLVLYDEQRKPTIFDIFIILGLLFSAISDFCICFNNLIGLIIFALAHISFIIGLNLTKKFDKHTAIYAAIIFIIVMVIVHLPKINLGSLRIPVYIYGLIISIMVGSALDMIDIFKTKPWFTVMCVTASLLFLLSDMELVFYLCPADPTKDLWFLKSLNPMLYISGQMCFALAIKDE